MSFKPKNFLRDLSAGKVAENRVKDLFEFCGYDAHFAGKRNPDWDIECGWDAGTKLFTIEVKYDMYEQRSGNFAIEVFGHQLKTVANAEYWSTPVQQFYRGLGGDLLSHRIWSPR